MPDPHSHLAPAVVEVAREVIDEWELGSLTDLILEHSRLTVEFRCGESNKDAAPATFAGGLPEVPSTWEWPDYEGKPLPFVAQVDLAEIPRVPSSALPANGILYFFCWCTNEIRENPCRVIWTDAGAIELSTAGVREEDIRPDWQGVRIYDSQRTSAIRMGLSVSADLLEQAVADAGRSEELGDAGFGDFPGEFTSDVELHLAGGEQSSTDDDAFLWGSALGFASLEFAMYDMAPTKAGYLDSDGDEELWEILLEVHSNGNMMWSDSGCLVFLIPSEDLRRGDFGRVKVQLHSS